MPSLRSFRTKFADQARRGDAETIDNAAQVARVDDGYQQESRSLAWRAGRTGEARGATGTERVNVAGDMLQHAPNTRLRKQDGPEPGRS